ncbi:DUF4440 domain-containing protein [Exiguobacterium aestuarii]|uniref:DUF4440 domain-containing protein n=1 Tax=Exiguobacterium aestuarii TaxID=273527 RepID=A0ABW2PKW3_9BACL|nr:MULTISPECIES: DUF4440 domain-containing protein [Exiguobacterium]MCT4785813.1 DUF4440 domain-containing protein [Exiguobacterium aestuarii]
MNELTDHLQTLEEALLTTEVRQSTERLRELLTDDFFEIGSSGRILYQDWNQSTLQLDPIEAVLSEFTLHSLTEGLVLVTYRLVQPVLKRETRRSSIWVSVDGRWKMRFHQGTVVPPEAT